MKKVLFAIFASLCLMMASASATFAVEPYEDTSGQDACALTGYSDPLLCGTPGGDEETEIQNKVVNVLNQVYLWIGIIAVVVIVISGIKYMTSQGSTEAIQKAKAGIMYASVGLVVVLGAFAITLAITNAIQGNQVATGPTGGTPVGPGGGGGGGGTPVSSLSITSGTQMMAGDTMQLRVRILPDYATDKRLTFSSSDSSVATVSSSGLVTAIKDGD